MLLIKDINLVSLERFLGLLNETVKGIKYKNKVII
jgi:hypothetical protein